MILEAGVSGSSWFHCTRWLVVGLLFALSGWSGASAQALDTSGYPAVGPGTWPGGYQDPQVLWWTADFGTSRTSSSPDPTGGVTPPPPPPAAPSISGYTDPGGAPISNAPPGTTIVIHGTNLGTTGA